MALSVALMSESTRPTGGGGARNPRSLINLKRGGNPALGGNRHGLTHGGYARVLPEVLDAKTAEVVAALSKDAPLRAPDGTLPAADTVVVRLFAEALCRLDSVAADIREHGWKDCKSGDPRPVAEYERRLRQEALHFAEALGMTPASRARLGLDLTRTVDLATAMSHPDPHRRRELMRDAGYHDGDSND